MNGNEFKAIRKQMKLSQQGLANNLQISLGTVCNIEKSQKVRTVYEYAIRQLSIQDQKCQLQKIADKLYYMA